MLHCDEEHIYCLACETSDYTFHFYFLEKMHSNILSYIIVWVVVWVGQKNYFWEI